jgi:hypothetical protein
MLSDLMENCAAALFRPSIMMTVLEIIMENVPELTALNLSESNLSALDSLILIGVKALNLRILHTGRNQVTFCIQSDHCKTIFHFVTCVSALC